MKMKQLRERTARFGCEVTERMIKYYVERGLIPKPVYTAVNQADYGNIHFIRILKICFMKEAGVSFSEIKKSLSSDDETAKKTAEKNGVTLEEQLNSFETYAMEESALYLSLGGGENRFDRQSLMEAADCERLVFNLAADCGALPVKEEYSFNDLVILCSVRNLFKINDEGQTETISKIGDVSKLNNIASQLVHIYAENPDNTWIYKNLAESMVRGKTESLCNQDRS